MATTSDTGWKPILVTGGDGEHQASGQIEMVQGSEVRPCFMCSSWEKDERRLIEHLIARGLEIQPNGHFKTPIAKDFPGRRSLIIDPKKYGFCRYETTVTEDLASCENWRAVRTAEDMAARIGERNKRLNIVR